MAKLTKAELRLMEAVIFKPCVTTQLAPRAKVVHSVKGKHVGRRRRLPSSVRVSHVDDYGAKYKRKEVDWKQYKLLTDLKTMARRVDYRKSKMNGKDNKRFGKKYADQQLWVVKIFRTKNRRFGEFKIYGKVGRVPLVRELAVIYSAMAECGIHIAYVHENTGLCYRGKPKILGTEEESLASIQERFHLGFARATSTIEHWIRVKFINKYGPDTGNRLADKEVKRALALPRANPDNEWGYGLKRKEIAPVKSGSEYVLNIGFRYMTNKKSAGAKERIKPVFLEEDKEQRKASLVLENLYPVRDIGSIGGHFRIGTESSVIKSIHKPKQRLAIEENIKAFVEQQMSLDEAQTNAMVAQRKFAKLLRPPRGVMKK